MDIKQLLDLFTKQQRVDIRYPGWRREATDSVIRHVSTTNEDGCVLHSKLSEETADEAIRQEIEYFQKLGQSFEWKVYDYDQPANLTDRLKAHGFEIGEAEALLVMNINATPSLLHCPIPPEIEKISDEKGIDDIMQLEKEVWGTSHDDLAERLKRDLVQDPDSLFIYAAYVQGKAVSAAWMYLHEGTSFGSLWGGSTLPAYRKQGWYTGLLAARAQAARDKGFPLLMVEASPMSRPILEKKGFVFLAYTYPCMSPRVPIEMEEKVSGNK